MPPSTPSPKPRGLRYVGPGFVPGIPARDLSAADIERYARRASVKPDELIASLSTHYRPSADGKE